MNIVDLFKLDGRKALVTGAGRGIGRVMAISLAEAGCDIGIFEKNLADAQNVVAEIKNWARKPTLSRVMSPKRMKLKSNSPL